MTKAELLSDLQAKFLKIGTETLKSDASTPETNRYIIPVFDSGLSDKNVKPVGWNRTIGFYVVDEGTVDEKAFYDRREPISEVDRNVSSDVDSLKVRANVYECIDLRKRVLAAVHKHAISIFQDGTASMNDKALAKAVSLKPSEYINIFMVIIAASSTIREGGTNVDDATIEQIISNVWSVIANSTQ